MSEILSIQRVTKGDITAYLPELACLRIWVFREYPYLYEGSTAYEEKYLQTYTNAPGGVMVLVRDGRRVVGASSGLPLSAATPNVIEPFVKGGYDPEQVFYYGESVLLPEYRRRGLGQRFFAEREAHVRALDRFDIACFCAVERPVDHPRRPANYRPLDEFWNGQGFVRHPELRTTFSWRDLDEAAESPKSMVFWLKRLV
ncbi:MAG TPA: GNAT family N-acetyltransferase [Candidatus Competibacteraceae bacterium]|nr:GNAT family N-acetyltransferase [Candidatus Competibacteraceae bacterium]HRZ05399.1 GNAT family N-acetyltransferase [Candidatus Competibacteraceae bacterium]HSA47085.1 GNAT family N-acetyltransferase [Candidatus Competibacteraceae bacterium]